MQEPIDPTLSVGDSKYADLTKKVHANSKQFCAKWNAGMEDFMNSMQVRRGYTDEMEKLIGVRDLGQHPDGIRGGVSALLGLTNQLEAKSSAGWNGFVIAELLNYFTLVGEDKILSMTESARRALSPAFVRAIVEAPGQSVGEFVDSLRKASDEAAKDIDVSNIDKVNEYVRDAIKAKWAVLSGDSKLTASALEEKLATELAQLFYWTLERRGIMVTVCACMERQLNKTTMHVSTTTHYMGVRYAKEYVLN